MADSGCLFVRGGTMVDERNFPDDSFGIVGDTWSVSSDIYSVEHFHQMEDESSE
jgi:hypothetical protein